MATQDERNARLDQLSKATTDWANSQRTYLQNQSALCKRILKGRTGSERLAQAAVNIVSALTVDQINQFLTGE